MTTQGRRDNLLTSPPLGNLNVAWLRGTLPKLLFVVACLAAAGGTSWAHAGCGSYLVMRRSTLLSHSGDIPVGISVPQPVRVNSALPFGSTTCTGSHCTPFPWEPPPCEGPHCQSRSRLPYTPPAGWLVVGVGEELIGIPSFAAVGSGASQRVGYDHGQRVPLVTLSGLLRPPRV